MRLTCNEDGRTSVVSDTAGSRDSVEQRDGAGGLESKRTLHGPSNGDGTAAVLDNGHSDDWIDEDVLADKG